MSELSSEPGMGSYELVDQPSLTLPDELWGDFVQRCDELEIPLMPEARQLITNLYTHLAGVNRWLNLTRLDSAQEYLRLHLLDSLMIVGHPLLASLEDGDRCIDLGSGSGYPGLALMSWYPQLRWSLVDSRKKKVEYLKRAVKLTPCCEAEALHFRGREVATAAPHLAARSSLVVARAVGQTGKLLDEANSMLCRRGYLMVYKGPAYDGAEHQEALKRCKKLRFDHCATEEVDLDGTEKRIIVTFQKR